MTELQLPGAFNLQLFRNLSLSGISLTVLIAYLPSSIFPRLLAYGFISCLLYDSFKYSTGEWLLDYVFGCGIAFQIISGFHLVFLANPLDNFRHEEDTVSPRSMTCLQRLWWALRAICSPLGVGWNHNVHKINARPRDTRLSFVISRLGHCLVYFMMVDISGMYILYNPAFGSRGVVGTLPSPAQGFVMAVVNTSAIGIASIGAISLGYTTTAVVSVATGLAEPQSWPPLFRSLCDTYSIRRFWGHTWHQLLYRLISGIGRSAVHMLGLAPGSRASSSIQLILGFLVSGLIHAGGDFMVQSDHFGVTGLFFLYQIIGIAFEDITLQILSQSQIKISPSLSRALGYVWVCCWLALTVPSFIHGLTVLGLQSKPVTLASLSPCAALLEYSQRRTGMLISELFRQE